MPYVMLKNGILVGSLFIVLGAIISYYTGMLLVTASERTNSIRYEDIAYKAYGMRMSRFTSVCNIICLLGFEIAYIVFVRKMLYKKNLLPSSAEDPLSRSFGQRDE